MRKYDDKIKELRSQGKTYREIREVVGCCNTTIGKCLDPEYNAKRNKQSMRWRGKNPVYSKCNNFNKRGGGNVTPEQVIVKFGDAPTCQLTGTPILWKDINSYSLDHTIPVARGGASTIENCQVTLKSVNQMKGELLVDELLTLCRDVLIHHGYTVTK